MDNKSLIIVAGNGTTAFSKANILKLTVNYKKHYDNVFLIGNGEKNISKEDIAEGLKKLKGQQFDICMHCHGTIDRSKNKFSFLLSENKKTASDEIFDIFTKTTDKPINMYIFSCYGGGALKDIDHLPKGSKAFSSCSDKDPLPGYDVQTFCNKLGSTSKKINNFENNLLLYLSSMQNRNSIVIAEQDKAIEDLLRKMINRTGNPLSNDDINYCKTQLSEFFPEEEILRIGNKFDKKGEFTMYAKEVGCAMAMSYKLDERNNLICENLLTSYIHQKE